MKDELAEDELRELRLIRLDVLVKGPLEAGVVEGIVEL